MIVSTPALELLHAGTVIPAHPLAITDDRRLDVDRQRALTRYYLASGAGGIAVGVHTTQFAIHEPSTGLLQPVLELAAQTVAAEATRPIVRIAGVCGPIEQAVAEAGMAADLGYDAALLSPVVDGASESDLIARTAAVGEILPVVGFYLQRAAGGPPLSLDYWRRMAALPCVVAVKAAPFNRYATIDVARAIAESGRADEIALYTGNDDAIVADLLTDYRFGEHTVRTVGGLLGHWAVWTTGAVRLHQQVRAARAGDAPALVGLLASAPQITDANAALFDTAHAFAGCIPGVHEVLRRQGLLADTRCLDPDEVLSPGQAEELTRVADAYPWMVDDDFVAEHRDEWLR